MRTSATVGKVMAGIAAVKRAVPFVEKTATAEIVGARSDRKERYVPFEYVAEAIRKPCEDAGIVWTQGGREGAGGTQWLVTRIDHPESGEYVESDLRVESAKAGFRDVGAALSYMRRVALIASFGIVARDEDPEADREAMRAAEPPKQRVTKGARPVNVPEDIGVRVEAALEGLLTCTTMAQIEEYGKTLRDEEGRGIVPRSDASRVNAAFAAARARVSAAMGQG